MMDIEAAGNSGEGSVTENSLAPTQDFALEALVGAINALGGAEVGITLHSSGLIVSGMLISGRSYFEKLIENLESSPDTGAHAFAQLFSPFQDMYANNEVTDAQKGAALLPTGYIHLRDARTFSPTGQSLPGTLWRARLTEITGWSLGNYTGPAA